jgi:hypothetical protein
VHSACGLPLSPNFLAGRRGVLADLPGLGALAELRLSPVMMARNQNRSTSTARCRTRPSHVHPDGSTGSRSPSGRLLEAVIKVTTVALQIDTMLVAARLRAP